jgi:acyl carrier protein
MNGTEKRVIACFLNVFPSLSENEIQRASTASLAVWDSVAHVTLLSAIGEEFGRVFELEDFEELVSFSLILDYLEDAAGNA